jgi:L-fuculose-phosphate aldolase
VNDPRKQLCELGALAYDRKLLDSAGGNFSIRAGNRIYCTPRYSGSRRRWALRPEEIVVIDTGGEQQEGSGEPSRETRMHVAIYREFPEAGAICHAHPLNVLVFANLRRPIPPTSEQTVKYGEIPLSCEVPAHSEALAQSVVQALRPQHAGLASHAIACLIPYHGISVVGRTLEDAYDGLERLDGSCHILISRAALALQDRLASGS